ncbi:hypothetical protein RRG08_051677 [Elysia crispata]|uniref:Uncharacterized protein n=1 Tax=Elysia crispata TaxID=231223 RepID=A0AAE1AFE4_9GAST|nr:hypothetical protein RRG08_051677 [Elysia crispata]
MGRGRLPIPRTPPPSPAWVGADSPYKGPPQPSLCRDRLHTQGTPELRQSSCHENRVLYSHQHSFFSQNRAKITRHCDVTTYRNVQFENAVEPKHFVESMRSPDREFVGVKASVTKLNKPTVSLGEQGMAAQAGSGRSDAASRMAAGISQPHRGRSRLLA